MLSCKSNFIKKKPLDLNDCYAHTCNAFSVIRKRRVRKDSVWTHIYVLSVTVLTLWVAPPEMFYSWYRI